MQEIGVGMRGVRVRIFVYEWIWWIKKVETDKNKDKMSAHLKKDNLHSLLWETNKGTNFKYFFSIDFFISIALALLINWKESILIVNGFYVIV